GICNRHSDGQERATLEQQNSGKFPSAYELIRQIVRSTSEPFSFADGKIIDEGRQEAVTARELHVAVVKPVTRVEAIRDPSAVLTREERGIVAALVRQIAGVHVAGSVLQPAGEALRDGNCARAVIAYCSVRFHERKTAGGIGNLRTYQGVSKSILGYLINVREETQL